MSVHLGAPARPAMQLRQRLGTLVVASAVALAALSVPAQAQAADNSPADPGVRCAAKTGPGQYEFYLPGERVTDVNGNKWVCGPDGIWFRDYSSALSIWTFGSTLLRSTTYSTATYTVLP